MKAVKPKYEILAVNGEDLNLLEVAGRTCYKSEPKGEPEKFIRARIKEGHHTILEHINHGFMLKHDNNFNFLTTTVVEQVSHIREKTEGIQLVLGSEGLFISVNPRTLREARQLANVPIVDIMISDVARQFPCLYEGLYDDRAVAPAMFTRMTSGAKLESGIPRINYATIRFICDRGVTHELVRHRMAVYSQESTRWCNYNNSGGIQIIHPDILSENQRQRREMNFWVTQNLYNKEIEEGLPPQIARGVLPTALKTEIVMTANFRELRLMFRQRALGTTGKPHPQMKELMEPLLYDMARDYPRYFGDLI